MGLVILLAIDTSSPSGSVAVQENQTTLGLVSTTTAEDYSSRMFRHVEWLLKELSLDLSRFDAFAVASGPGSFTGLRVGLAAVKGWAEACNRPILSVSVLEAIAAQSRSSTTLLAPVFDARRKEVYFGFYPPRTKDVALPVPEPEGDAHVSSVDDFLGKVTVKAEVQEVTIVTPNPEIVTERLQSLNASRGTSLHISIETVSSVLAPVIAKIGWHRAQLGKFETALSLDADYVRRTDAELKWKAPSVQQTVLKNRL
jgi:tRNA threonylcarbamoyladenosine biosynthesis protein TsaB